MNGLTAAEIAELKDNGFEEWLDSLEPVEDEMDEAARCALEGECRAMAILAAEEAGSDPERVSRISKKG